MSFFGSVVAVLTKDLVIELRSRELLVTTIIFSLLVVLLSAFALGLDALPAAEAASGVFWIAVAFGGILALSRTFQRERDFGVFTSLLMTPAPRSAIYLGKALGVFAFLLATEAVLAPIVALFFHAPLLGSLGGLSLIAVLGTLGYAAVGTLFAAMTVRTRLRDLLLGVILYPLVAPILIAAVKGTTAVLAGGGLADAADYIELLVVADAIYIVGGLWLFGPLMED